MRFKSSVLKTIKVCQNFHIRSPKRLPYIGEQIAAHIKQATPTHTCKRHPTARTGKYDGYK